MSPIHEGFHTSLSVLYLRPVRIRCPHCGGNAARISTGVMFAGGEKAYCGSCGWNVPSLAEHLRGQCRAALVGAFLGVYLAGFAYLNAGWSGAFPVGGIFVLTPALFGWLSSEEWRGDLR